MKKPNKPIFNVQKPQKTTSENKLLLTFNASDSDYDDSTTNIVLGVARAKHLTQVLNENAGKRLLIEVMYGEFRLFAEHEVINENYDREIDVYEKKLAKHMKNLKKYETSLAAWRAWNRVFAKHSKEAAKLADEAAKREIVEKS
jgi:hypothetical protein